MRGVIRFRILEAIANGATDLSDHLRAIGNAGYNATVAGIESEYRKIKRKRAQKSATQDMNRASRQRLAQTLYFLKRDGLLEKSSHAGKTGFRLTRAGRSRLDRLRERVGEDLPALQQKAPISNVTIIVSFDIPEKERRKRRWLRDNLRAIGLQKLQQSVWIGKRRLPETFIDDIGTLDLSSRVEIFEIKTAGTLRRIA